MPDHPSLTRYACWAQGLYYTLFGAWPLLHMTSFIWVTGKRGKYDNLDSGQPLDHWLVLTVAGLLIGIGIHLILASRNRTVTTETFVLAVLSALVLAIVDVTFASRRIIEPIYYIDAAIQVAFIAVWLLTILRSMPRPRSDAKEIAT
jgi:hypothetical protein